MNIVVVVTYLSGSAWGPQVAMQEFFNEETCRQGVTIIEETVKEMNKSNLQGGTTMRGHHQDDVHKEAIMQVKHFIAFLAKKSLVNQKFYFNHRTPV